MIRKQPSEKYNLDCIVQRTKQGSGSVGIWCCVTYYGLGMFKLFDGRLNSTYYVDILNNNLLPSINALELSVPFIFQQDNAPCHRAKIVSDSFESKNIERLTWPPNSPDLNCIENLWSGLDKEISKKAPRSLEELRNILPAILGNVPKHILENSIDSMPNLINDCFYSSLKPVSNFMEQVLFRSLFYRCRMLVLIVLLNIGYVPIIIPPRQPKNL